MGVGDIEVGLSAAVRSLECNLRADLGVKFLHGSGLPSATAADARRLASVHEATIA
jgi:hypothetical protein